MERVAREKRLSMAGVDWQAAWELKDSRREKPSGPDHWSARSKSYAHGMELGEYEAEFIERAGIAPGETVLDFGCGVGMLAVPLAKMGCKVVACDFSQGMLDRLAERSEAAGVSHLVETHLMAWDDDWEAAGILADSVDVAIASRSIATSNLLGALVKLDRAARRRVCITLASGGSPRRDERAFDAIGRTRPYMEDFAFCMNILFQHGAFPELSYIVTRSRPGFANREDAYAQLVDMLGNDLTPAEEWLLGTYLDEHYSFDPTAHPDRAFASDGMREVRWAFISW